jgi:hypothetical protein
MPDREVPMPDTPTPTLPVVMLPCADIQIDEAIQPRERLDHPTITEYTETYATADPDQEPFPPIDIFDIGDTDY